MNKIALGIIFGGKSSEYYVSLHSAASLLRQIDAARYEITMIAISQKGEWFLYEGSIDALEHDHWRQEKCTPCALTHGGLLILHAHEYELRTLDCIFPVLHGKNGEDGTIQGLFELCDIPFVGCDHMSSAICMDKEMTHIIVEHAGIPCAPYMSVYAWEHRDPSAVYEEAKEKLGLPFFIKPCNAGSSYGIHCVESPAHFAEDLADAFYHDGKGKVILEKAIKGFEIGCAVMGNEELIAGSVDEIEISGSFFDYEGKYEMKDAAIYCPARIDETLFKAAQDMAKRAYRAMNCSGMTRVDMFVTPSRTIIFNELNTIPGFTATSRYPSMMKEIGIPFPQLIDDLVDLALQRKAGGDGRAEQ